MFVSPQAAARMIDGFMVGAVMQQDPFLEEFGSLPEEPPDEDPCWDAKQKSESSLEQGMLFSLPEPPKPKAIHPTRPKKPTTAAIAPIRSDELPPPYVPRHIPYNEYLKVFNGDHSLTLYWFNQQAIKE